MEAAAYWRSRAARAGRVVVKVGSGVLSGKDGLDTRRLGRLAGDLAAARDQGRSVALVSSGAIAAGFKRVGLGRKPESIREFQACAAVGQAGLVMAWEKALERRGHKAAQVLLTADDLSHRRRYLNARNTLTTLLEWGIIPIINENDTVVVAEIKFGDNDTLGGMIAGLIDADLFVNLTDIDGLYDGDPRSDPDARFVPMVENFGARVEEMAGRIPGALGAGGMYTKIQAAKRLSRQGLPSIIANGVKPGVLRRVLAGEEVGTIFLPRAEKINKRKGWIAFTAKPRGCIVVDAGAQQALVRGGKSLLPTGVLGVEGGFRPGDSVRIETPDGELVAVGLCNYSAEELGRIAGCQTCDIETLLGHKHSDEVVHRDNMVVGDSF